MGYFCDFITLITVLKSTHNNVKLVPLESVDRDESNGTNFRYQLEKMSQQVKKIFQFAILPTHMKSIGVTQNDLN